MGSFAAIDEIDSAARISSGDHRSGAGIRSTASPESRPRTATSITAASATASAAFFCRCASRSDDTISSPVRDARSAALGANPSSALPIPTTTRTYARALTIKTWGKCA